MPTNPSHAFFFATKTHQALDKFSTSYLKLQACDRNTKLFKALNHTRDTTNILSSYGDAAPNTEAFADQEDIIPLIQKLYWQLTCLASETINSAQSGLKYAPSGHKEDINTLWCTLLNQLNFNCDNSLFSVFTKKNRIEQYLQNADFTDASIETLRKSLMEFSFRNNNSVLAATLLKVKKTYEDVNSRYTLFMLSLIGYAVMWLFSIALSLFLSGALWLGGIWTVPLLGLAAITTAVFVPMIFISTIIAFVHGVRYWEESKDNKKLAASQFEIVTDAHIDLMHFISSIRNFLKINPKNNQNQNENVPPDLIRYQITIKIPDRSVLQFFQAPKELINQCNAVDTFCDELRSIVCPKIEPQNQSNGL